MKFIIKALLLCAIMFMSATAFSQIPCSLTGSTTTNLGLNIPAYGTQNWNVPLNADMNCLDSYLSGNTAIPALQVQGPITARSVVATTYNPPSVYAYGDSITLCA